MTPNTGSKRPKRGRGLAPPPTGTARGGLLHDSHDSDGDLLNIPLDDLCPNPFNKRRMSGIEELAETIDKVGLLQSIAHIPADIWLEQYPETREQITAENVILYGEHRWRAMCLLRDPQRLDRPVISSILSGNKVADARLITLIENLRRAQLAALEEAEHYAALHKDGHTFEQIAQMVGETATGAISKGTVSKRIKLLHLIPEARAALDRSEIGVSAAEHVVKLEGEEQQKRALDLITQGARPLEAYNQVLRGGIPAQVEVGQDETPVVSNGNDGGTSETSAGNPDGAPKKAQKKQPKPEASSTRKLHQEAAVAREAACVSLLQRIDVQKDADLVMKQLASALLGTSQQQPAIQQQALSWLARAGRQGSDESHVGKYFTSVQEGEDENLQRLAAFACALAAAELRTAARRQKWGHREQWHIRLLKEHVGYEPSDWELQQLGVQGEGATS